MFKHRFVHKFDYADDDQRLKTLNDVLNEEDQLIENIVRPKIQHQT